MVRYGMHAEGAFAGWLRHDEGPIPLGHSGTIYSPADSPFELRRSVSSMADLIYGLSCAANMLPDDMGKSVVMTPPALPPCGNINGNRDHFLFMITENDYRYKHFNV